MRYRTWKILDRGTVGDNAPMVCYGGPCGHDAMLPVNGTVIAEAGGRLIFEGDVKEVPVTIHCRKCGRTYTNAPEET